MTKTENHCVTIRTLAPLISSINAMEVDKYILTEALSAILGVTVKLQSDCKDFDKVTQLQITSLTTLALLDKEVQNVTCLTSLLKRLSVDQKNSQETQKSDIVSSSLRKELFVISDDFFDPVFDFDFTNMSESKSDECTRGDEPYKRPYGWMRFALKVRDKYPDGNAWLGTYGWRSRSVPVLSEGDTMGCTSSTQTTAQDTTRPNTKQDGSTSGTSNENGGPAADSETIPDQTQAEESPQTSSAPPEASEEIQSSEAAVAHSEPEAAAAEAVTSDQPAEAESSPSTTAENTDEPAPSENTTEAQAESSPPEEAPASGENS
ncbi:uncharacterized protein [Sinocyclocheilus grahami]|uniref:uncharacterized protein isoform X1 n=1 Tax=Sinocyclocheilus grahami TaxID=75366 RepID=UPI0007ACDB88|nr:PREDICTED: uncharacterized protein LOC107565198 isoform X1 [Sinocyclocheilus grahami]